MKIISVTFKVHHVEMQCKEKNNELLHVNDVLRIAGLKTVSAFSKAHMSLVA